MAGLSKKRGTEESGLDVAKLGAEIGAEVVEGELSIARAKGTLKVKRKTFEVNPGVFFSKQALAKLPKGKLPLVVSGENILSIGHPKWPKWCYVLCYLVGPEWIEKIRPEIQKELLARYVKEKVISEALAKEFEKAL